MTSLSSARVESPRSTGPADVLSRLRADTPFFLTSPSGALRAEGTRELLCAPAGDRLADEARALLTRAAREDVPAPLLVGALPFDSRQPALLRLPRRVDRGGPVRPEPGVPAREPVGLAARVQASPAPEDYARSVREALSLIQHGELQKVVLSRACDVELPGPVDVPLLLRRLVAQNPGGHTFAVDLPTEEAPGRGPRRLLVGSSPELLVSRHGGRIVAQPLAGSVPRSPDPVEDERRRRALLVSEKDLREHAIVVDSIREALAPVCKVLRVPPRPTVISTPTLWHLSTRIVGTPRSPGLTSLDLALRLHPTPAVCGEPAEAARKAIGTLEPHDRGFFTGAVGWCDRHGDGEWIVAIRCAEVSGPRARLFAGAGIVAGSRPDAEVAETGTKLRTMLRALGLD